MSLESILLLTGDDDDDDGDTMMIKIWYNRIWYNYDDDETDTKIFITW